MANINPACANVDNCRQIPRQTNFQFPKCIIVNFNDQSHDSYCPDFCIHIPQAEFFYICL